MSKNVNEIYIGKDLFWTSSVKSYFENERLDFPVNFSRIENCKSFSLEKGERELSEKEKNDLRKFYKYISKNITFDECKNWKKNAVGFNIGEYGIYEENDKKYFIVAVYAYSENCDIYDRVVKVDRNDITVLYNILMFDYETYEKRGWIF